MGMQFTYKTNIFIIGYLFKLAKINLEKLSTPLKTENSPQPKNNFSNKLIKIYKVKRP